MLALVLILLPFYCLSHDISSSEVDACYCNEGACANNVCNNCRFEHDGRYVCFSGWSEQQCQGKGYSWCAGKKHEDDKDEKLKDPCYCTEGACTNQRCDNCNYAYGTNGERRACYHGWSQWYCDMLGSPYHWCGEGTEATVVPTWEPAEPTTEEPTAPPQKPTTAEPTPAEKTTRQPAVSARPPVATTQQPGTTAGPPVPTTGGPAPTPKPPLEGEKPSGGAKTSIERVMAYFGNWAIYDSMPYSRNFKPFDMKPILDGVTHRYTDPNADIQTAYQGQFPGMPSWKESGMGNLKAFEILKQKQPHLKFIYSVGGWSLSAQFSKCSADKALREKMIADHVKWVEDHPIVDGLDIDWEYPTCCGDWILGDPAGLNACGAEADDGSNSRQAVKATGEPTCRKDDWKNYVLYLKELREALDVKFPNDHKELSIAVGITLKMRTTNPDDPLAKVYTQLCDVLDSLNLMTYDIHGSWERTTNFQAPLHFDDRDPSSAEFRRLTIDAIVKEFTDTYKCPPHKLSLGLPLYGRSWNGVSPGPNNDGMYQPATGAPRPPNSGPKPWPAGGKGSEQTGATIELGHMSVWDIIDNYEDKNGFKKYYNEATQTAYVYNPNTKIWVGYDDKKAILAKMHLAHSHSLGGVFVWLIDDDRHFDVWNEMHRFMVSENKEGASSLTEEASAAHETVHVHASGLIRRHAFGQ
ncbi:unnamed protein product [Vitrella brassicaformis CCMP3155]|uniref:GH18 domain-containing protein n=1 Tax=Vitrella brassicaformis (strain CCMP3155) TaxID=1169540 RepID=A0A0G4GG21_VITBC|nr:unnamed protein product [Vitrella brassicaformis CCMP3155]|eukprot:CEM28522.1 unnamed protein product [Vitrella brassicaformis CCMP3155]